MKFPYFSFEEFMFVLIHDTNFLIRGHLICSAKSAWGHVNLKTYAKAC